MKRFSLATAFTVVLYLVAFSGYTQGLRAYDIALKMFEKSREVTSMRYILTKKERVNGQLTWSRNLGKLTIDPYRVYMKKLEPDGGMEILFVEGANKNKLLINPNGFPWMNVSLEPHSPHALKNQHHTIYEAGFRYFASIAEYVLNTYGIVAPQTVKLEGSVSWNGMSCYYIVQENPSFRYVDYKVKKGENLLTIAKKNRLNALMIIEKNPHLTSHDQVIEGQVIKIPTYYCKRMELYISKQLMLPVLLKIYDDKGLFEEYNYEDLDINSGIPDEEFRKDFEDYNF
jgi:outer membrane lipoprotein-sorting protein